MKLEEEICPGKVPTQRLLVALLDIHKKQTMAWDFKEKSEGLEVNHFKGVHQVTVHQGTVHSTLPYFSTALHLNEFVVKALVGSLRPGRVLLLSSLCSITRSHRVKCAARMCTHHGSSVKAINNV